MADPYTIQLAASAVKELEGLPRRAQERVAAAIERLVRDPRPRGVEKLSGFRDLYRIRVGQYRVVYRIDDGGRILDIARIRTRRDAYRR